MTDEKKPPQEVAVDGAQIVIDINAQGLMRMSATCFGRPDSIYSFRLPEQMLAVDLPCLVGELQLQLQQRRFATVAESASIRAGVAQGASGASEWGCPQAIERAKLALLEAQTNLQVLLAARIAGHPVP